jgi:hypothetical protein
MKGDFSRLTFRPGKRYTSVRLQQGRVTLDSDWNEQAAIREYLERVRFEDVVGTSAVPCGAGFAVTDDRNGSLALSAGRIYVGGFACELHEPAPLKRLLRNPLAPASGRTDLLYLDVWERHLTAVDDPELLDVALGGADTTTRLKVVWSIGVVEDVGRASCSEAASLLPQQPNGVMRAAAPGGYQGSENQLYRVEIHDGGALGSATFKWSRDNGSVVFPVEEFLGPESVRLAPRRDAAWALDVGDWVEVSGEECELAGAVGTLARIADVRDGATAVLDRDVSRHRSERHPRIRRWDQRSGATVPVSTDWVELEAGIEVRFSDGEFRSGDYWTMPARPATGSIEWPEDEPPYGIEHRLCPLALVTWEQAENAWKPMIQDCRRAFSPLTEVHEELTRLQFEVAELRSRLRAREG